MMMLEHLTLSSGRVYNSPRSEAADERVDKIRAALAANGVLEGGWSVDLLLAPEGTHIFDLVSEDTHAVRCWLCNDGIFTVPLWEKARAHIPPELPPIQPRRMPWLASALLPGAVGIVMSNPRVLAGAAALERCVAWALIEIGRA